MFLEEMFLVDARLFRAYGPRCLQRPQVDGCAVLMLEPVEKCHSVSLPLGWDRTAARTYRLVCREIVEAHDGCIGISSQPGVGSLFWFELPAL